MLAGSADSVRNFLNGYSTLFDAAGHSAARRTVAGRGPAFAVATAEGQWLVRHYRRGGALARILGDRYPRMGEPRAFRELDVSLAARASGIATPEVVAAAAYPAGIFRRCDIAVVFMRESIDLAGLLFEHGDRDIDDAAAKAAALIRTICERGLLHPDLNLKNILIAPDAGYVVDLDRCRMAEPSRENADRMRRRLLRSLEKWQARTRTTVPAPVRRTLEEAFRAAW